MRCSTRCVTSCAEAVGALVAARGVTHHASADAFLAAVEPQLARNAAVRAFVTAWAATWRDDPGARPLVAATCAIDGAYGFALRRDGPLVIDNSDPRAAAALAEDLAARGVRFAHVIGEEPACRAFVAAWQARVPCVASIAMRMRHHMLTQLVDLPPAPGLLRAAHEDDTPWLARHAQAFVREARLPDRPQDVRASVRRRVRQRGVRVWVDDGARVAFASVVIVGACDARIGLVYTLPRHRGRRYATTLVGAMVRECLAAGVQRVFLLTDVDNPTSNGVYARLGFEPVSDQVRIDVGPAGGRAS
jgi:predicted GNAT family acetyltransferase